MDLSANAGRFAGFAELYDAVRPQPPAELGALLWSYLGGRPARIVDLGSGTGLSTRWAAEWAGEVVGVEPSADMRATAAAKGGATYVDGWAHATGLPDGCADVVLAVQAMHWMEPVATLAEVARLLRPGGMFAAVDCDWPPTVGVVAAEQAWHACRKTVRIYETRLGRGLTGDELLAPVEADDPALAGYSGRDHHKDRTLAEGVQSWSKDAHLQNIRRSGHFAWTHEVALHRIEDGDADRLVGLMRSQGDYQALRRAGLDDERLGIAAFERACHEAMGERTRALVFTYRVRLGHVEPGGSAPT